MKEVEKIIRALKVFGNNTILYDSESGETISFQDVIDFIKTQSAAIAKNDELLGLQKENIAVTHDNNNTLRSEIERLKQIIGGYVADQEIWISGYRGAQAENEKLKSEIERLKDQHLKLMNEHDEYGNLALERLCEIDELKEQNAELQKQVNECNRDCEEYAIENGEFQQQVDELKGKVCELVADKCNLIVKEKQAVKDTAKEILQELWDETEPMNESHKWVRLRIKNIAMRKGVEVE